MKKDIVYQNGQKYFTNTLPLRKHYLNIECIYMEWSSALAAAAAWELVSDPSLPPLMLWNAISSYSGWVKRSAEASMAPSWPRSAAGARVLLPLFTV
jgi:hypothetical protein